MNGRRKTVRRGVHEQGEQQREDDDDRQAFEALENIDTEPLLAIAPPPQVFVLEFDEIFGQLDHRHVLGQDLADHGAAIENDQAVGDLVDVGEIVFDVDARAPRRLDAPDEVDDLAHLGHAERGGRFVEDDQIGVEMHGAADRNALALAARQIADGRIHRDAVAAKADDVHQDLVGQLLLALDVDEAETVGDLPADEEVSPQRLLLGERLVLIDRLDRQVMRHADRVVGEIDRLVADENAAGGWRRHAGHHLDERRLAGAVIADQADDFIPSDRQVDISQRMNRAKIFVHVFETNDRIEAAARPAAFPFPMSTPRP